MCLYKLLTHQGTDTLRVSIVNTPTFPLFISLILVLYLSPTPIHRQSSVDTKKTGGTTGRGRDYRRGILGQQTAGSQTSEGVETL